MGTTKALDCPACACCNQKEFEPCSSKCCKCSNNGGLDFDIIDCQAYYVEENPDTLMDNWYPIDSCCSGMSFTMSRSLGYLMCTQSGMGPGNMSPDGVSCLTTGTGAGQPPGTGIDTLDELWGFSGTVCTSCSGGPQRESGVDPTSGWEDPHFAANNCDGMCLRASFCCCPDPVSGARNNHNVGPAGGKCAGGSSTNLPDRTSTCRCATMCYKFTMESFECHEIDASVLCPVQTGTFMSACSPCSFLQSPTVTGIFGSPGIDEHSGCTWGCEQYATATGANMGSWQTWATCPPDVARGSRECGMIPHTGSATCSGQCPSDCVLDGDGNSTKTGCLGKLMLIVDGVYESQCDCAKGQFNLMCDPDDIYKPSGVGYMKSVFVKFTGLLSSSD